MTAIASRRQRRAELRRARKAMARAYQRATAGVATKSRPWGEVEQAACAPLFSELEARHEEMRALLDVAGVEDGAIFCMVPDDDDRAMVLAMGRLSALEGDADALTRSAAMVASRATLVPMDRRELLATLTATSGWHEDALALLRQPPAGALLVAFDGSETGHGVLAIGPLATGGDA